MTCVNLTDKPKNSYLMIKRVSKKNHFFFFLHNKINKVLFASFFFLIIYLLNTPKQIKFKLIDKFLNLQFPVTEDDTNEIIKQNFYDVGIDDTYFIITWTLILILLRFFFMKCFFYPLTYRYLKIKQKHFDRTLEQSWNFLYYTYSFVSGFFLYLNSPYYLSFDNLFLGWPHNRMSRSLKFYYLRSISFWLLQLFVINIEKRRTDHYQMIIHHVITVALMLGSYFNYFSRVGHVILMLMDFVDIFLAGAKVMKYIGFKKICDITFIFFLFSWIIMRHGVYNYITYLIWKKSKILIFDSNCINNISTGSCHSHNLINIFLVLLVGLQILTIIWLYFILKVAYKVIFENGAEDIRSDDEDNNNSDFADK